MNEQRLAFDLGRDMRVLSAMVSNLTPYLYEEEMYGHLSGDLPKLTLGGLLMRLYRLTHLDLNAEQETTVQNARHTFETERAAWAVHYNAKLQHELQSRLNALDRYLSDCAEESAGCAAGYPVQAEKRVMIEHLRDEADERGVLPEELSLRMRQVDQRLRRALSDGEFVFDLQLQAVYPADKFWWLYSRISDSRR